MEVYYGKSSLHNSESSLFFLDFLTNLNSLLGPLKYFPILKPVGDPIRKPVSSENIHAKFLL